MSRETNKGVIMHLKTITMSLSTIVHLLVKPITSLAKPKASLEASMSIKQLSWAVTSSKSVISPSLFSFFFFGNMLRYNGYSWGTVESRVGNSAYSCGGRNTTRKMKCTESKTVSPSYTSSRGGMFFSGVPLSGENIVEEILSKSFWEFSDADQFFVVVSLNPITKHFPTISNINSRR